MRLWGPVILYLAAITALSHQPVPAPPAGAPDWLMHLIEFGGLGALVARALDRSAPGLSPKRAGWAAAGCAAFGLLDEAHQSFVPGRVADLRDAAVDAAGAAAVIGLWMIFASRRRVRAGAGGAASPETAGGIPIRLYGRKGCHLCDEAEAVIRRVTASYHVQIDKVDVDGDEDLRRRYGETVPVVTIGGRRMFKYRVDPDRLRRVLDSMQRRRPT